MSGFRCTGIHPYYPDVILSQVYAPNERFKGCVIDVNERTDNSEEGNNEDEMSNQENNEDEDNNQDNNYNDGIDIEHNIERECGNGDEDNITDTDHVSSIVEALQESGVTASKRNIESVVINTSENNPSIYASAVRELYLHRILLSYFKHRHPEKLHNSLGNVLLDLGRVLQVRKS